MYADAQCPCTTPEPVEDVADSHLSLATGMSAERGKDWADRLDDISTETELYNIKPIGYLRTPFLFKNGTPRQPTVCGQARGELTVLKSIFNNPEHSLDGLEHFTHIWIFFIFHKNNNAHTKAKVKPPRLDGRKVGVFSTRSPYRPNNIGLTLARIESIQGATLTVSGLDIIDGTPVVDLKPYIPQYDSLACRGQRYPDQCSMLDPAGGDHAALHYSGTDARSPGSQLSDIEDNTVEARLENRVGTANDASLTDVCVQNNSGEAIDTSHTDVCVDGGEVDGETQTNCQDTVNTKVKPTETCIVGKSLDTDICTDASTCEFKSAEKKACKIVDIDTQNLTDETVTEITSIKNSEVNVNNENHDTSHKNSSQDLSDIKQSEQVSGEMGPLAAADWIDKPPVSTLHVRFTATAEQQLKSFSPIATDDNFKLLHLKSSTEAREAIVSILQEDPRSTYRRKNCMDSLYYFTVDVVHVTCWFDEGLVEVVRVKPACLVQQCKQVFAQLVR